MRRGMTRLGAAIPARALHTCLISPNKGGSLILSFFSKRERMLGGLERQRENLCRHTLCIKAQGHKKRDNVAAATDVSEVVIGDPMQFERKKSLIKAAGPSSLQVIADFDMTLTKYWVNGERGMSSHALLKQGNLEYDNKREQLFDYYHPLEISPNIPIDTKTKLMEEWWEKTHGLLVEGGLHIDAIKNSVANARINFRDGVYQLFKILEEKDVPILIFSAGLADIIEEVIHQRLPRVSENVRVISNRMKFDEGGNLVAFQGRTIHVLNKNEHALKMSNTVPTENGREWESEKLDICERKNVLLLGDHLGDLGMSDGLDFSTRITVGFLNDNIDNWIETYRQSFDVVVTNDGDMKYVVDLVNDLLCS